MLTLRQPGGMKALPPRDDDRGRERAALCLRTLAHPTRIKIIQLLARGDYSVGELARECGVASHVISEHLALMRDRDLLRCERRGRRKYYRIYQPALSEIIECIERRFGIGGP